MEFFRFAGKRDSYQNEKYLRGCRLLEAELHDMDRVLAGRCVFCCFSFLLSFTATKLSNDSSSGVLWLYTRALGKHELFLSVISSGGQMPDFRDLS